jgi:hypothetical protein
MSLTKEAAATGRNPVMAAHFNAWFVERSRQMLGTAVAPGTLREAQDLACRMAGDGEFTAALKCAEAWWVSQGLS